MLEVYTRKGCKPCEVLKENLRKLGIMYQVRDAESLPHGALLSVPQIVRDGQTIVIGSPSLEYLRKALKKEDIKS